MARRKNGFLSDGSDSDASVSEGSEGGYNSQEDADSKAERALFEHKGNKRRKMAGTGGKDAAWEGIFGAGEEEYRAGGRGLGARRGRGGGSSSRTDWTKAPAFVTKKNVEDSIVAVDDTEEENATSEEDEDDESEDTKAHQSQEGFELPEDELGATQRPDLGGSGLKNPFAPAGTFVDTGNNAEAGPSKSSGRAGIGSSSRGRGGIGSSDRVAAGDEPSTTQASSLKGGIGSSTAPSNPIAESAPATNVPSAFGRPSVNNTASDALRPRKGFMGRETAAPTPRPTILTAKEAAHFANIGGTFGAKMLQNMGWSAGEGLGKDKSGRAVPIEVGKVLKGQGLQSGMRTEDSKRDARRRGDVVSEDEDEKPRRRGTKKGTAVPSGQRKEQDQSWKKQKKVKVRVEHKTYEQLLAEAGDGAPPGVGLVLDARGGDLREVQSLSSLSLSSWTPTSDKTQLPELRHNLRLIVDVSKGDVDALAREGKAVNEKRRWGLREEETARAKIEATTSRIDRIIKVQQVVSSITTTAAQQASHSDPSLYALTDSFETLLSDFGDEYAALSLDEVLVGAIAQVLRRAFSEWQPFDLSSDILLSSLKQWRKAYNLPRNEEEDQTALTVNGSIGNGSINGKSDRDMTAWESLLWTLWLPKVRAAINNDWDAASPLPAVHLLESWDPILPPFVRDNILDQLIMPKVKQAIDDWDGRKSRSGKNRSLAGIVFPWLPMLGDRIEEVLEGAKRRIRHVLRVWTVKDGVLEELARWKKDMYSSKEWDELMLRFIVPKLGVTLRDDFTINPRKQDMVPLEDWVMPWHTLLRGSTFAQLLEVNFAQKWLDILYIWLIQPNYKPDEVANWFVWWKGRFPEPVIAMKGIAHIFNAGLELMNDAMRLGSDAPTRLLKPVFVPLAPSKAIPKATKTAPRKAEVPTATDITFRSLAEDYATQNDLIFLPVGRSHDKTGKPLFKVCKSVTGRGGVTVYVGENAVFAQVEDGTYKAVSLDDMVKRALA